MEEQGTDFRQWDELIPDALGLIFKKLSLKDVLTVIPRVCKAWGKAVQGPYCWQEIDIDEWSTQCQPDQLDRMLRLLVTRSCGSLRKLHVSCVNNDQLFDFITEQSEISDSMVEKAAEKLSRITSLDLSYCRQIGTRALEAIGKNCKFLSSLSLNMHPLDTTNKPSHSEEAHAIAKTMPKLKQLEIAYLHVDNVSIFEILSGCPYLESLDLRGCWSVNLDKKYLTEKHPNLKVLGPHVIMGAFESLSYYNDFTDSDYDDDYEDDMDYSDEETFYGMWDDGGVELRFYEGSEMHEFGWPPSP